MDPIIHLSGRRIQEITDSIKKAFRLEGFFAVFDFQLIPVVFRFERSGFGYSQVFGLRSRKLIQLNPDLGEVQTGYFLVEVLGQYVYLSLIHI